MTARRLALPLAEPLEPPRKLAHRLVEALTEEIRGERLRAGERLPTEPALMARFGVSRTVVREAMSQLQAAGLVVTRQGSGTFVRAADAERPLMKREPAGEQTLADKLEMLELRMSVESEAAALAAQRRTPEQLETLRRLLDDFASAMAIGASTVAEDARFHLQIALATGNRYFEEVQRSLGNATISREGVAGPGLPATEGGRPAPVSRVTSSSPALAPRKAVVLSEHEAIFDAIRRADPQAARAAMFMHLSNSLQRLRALAGLET